MDDSQIIDLYFRRSEQAIAETAAQYGALCHAIAYNILSDRQDSEECVSDTYMTVWNRIPPEKPHCFSAYLSRITRNLSIDRWRKNHAARRGGGQLVLAIEELDRTLSSGQNVEDLVIGTGLRDCLDRFLKTLPDTERRVFILRYFYLDPISDISRQFGFTQSKVKSMLQRTRKRLKAYLLTQGGTDV